LKDYSPMSKEELIANIEELKANLEIIENAFQDIKNASSLKIPDEAFSKLQEELNKTREGMAKLENLLSEQAMSALSGLKPETLLRFEKTFMPLRSQPPPF